MAMSYDCLGFLGRSGVQCLSCGKVNGHFLRLLSYKISSVMLLSVVMSNFEVMVVKFHKSIKKNGIISVDNEVLSKEVSDSLNSIFLYEIVSGVGVACVLRPGYTGLFLPDSEGLLCASEKPKETTSLDSLTINYTYSRTYKKIH